MTTLPRGADVIRRHICGPPITELAADDGTTALCSACMRELVKVDGEWHRVEIAPVPGQELIWQ